MKKITGLVILTIVSALFLVACGGENDTSSNGTSSDNGEDLHIEVVAKGFQHQFWTAVSQGAEQAASDYGVTMNFTGPANETAIQEQNQMLSNAINQSPAAIALASLDTESQIDLISQAQNSGIPIIGFDSGVPGAPEGSIAANASTDNYAAAELGAENIFDAISEEIDSATTEASVRIGIVSQEVNSMSIRTRTEGFMDRIVELAATSDNVSEDEIAIVGHDRYNNGVSESDAKVVVELQVPAQATDAAIQVSAQTLFNKPDLIAIFGTNELGGNGIINANQATGNRLQTDVVGGGFDSGALQIDAVRNGVLHGAITQNPVQIGYMAIELAVKAINGEDVSDVDTGAVWYNASNVDNEDVQALLYE